MNKPVLTQREMEIMALCENGMSAKDMANELFISKRTVEFHITNLMRKFRVGNKMAMVAEYKK